MQKWIWLLFVVINVNAVDFELQILSQDEHHVTCLFPSQIVSDPRFNTFTVVDVTGNYQFKWHLALTNTQENESYFFENGELLVTMGNIEGTPIVFENANEGASQNNFPYNEFTGGFPLEKTSKVYFNTSEGLADSLPKTGQTVVATVNVRGTLRITTTDEQDNTTTQTQNVNESIDINVKIFPPPKLEGRQAGRLWGTRDTRFENGFGLQGIIDVATKENASLPVSQENIPYTINTEFNSLVVENIFEDFETVFTFENGSPEVQRNKTFNMGDFNVYQSFNIQGFSTYQDVPSDPLNPVDIEPELCTENLFLGAYNRKNLSGTWKFTFIGESGVEFQEEITVTDSTPVNAEFATTYDQIFDLSGQGKTSFSAQSEVFLASDFELQGSLFGQMEIFLDFSNPNWQASTGVTVFRENGKFVMESQLFGTGNAPKFFRAEFPSDGIINPPQPQNDKDIQRENDGDPVTKETPFNNPTVSELKNDGSIQETMGTPSNNICDICPCSDANGAKIQTELPGESRWFV